VKVHEADLSSDLQGSFLKPAEQTGWGVVVLAGSSGIVDVARAKLFAGLGAVCIALRWFGGERQAPGICEVPLEVFTRATAPLRLEALGERLHGRHFVWHPREGLGLLVECTASNAMEACYIRVSKDAGVHGAT
jgi:hypothetical protein